MSLGLDTIVISHSQGEMIRKGLVLYALWILVSHLKVS